MKKKIKSEMTGVRFSAEEMKLIKKQLKAEHLDYVSTLIRKAVFFYIEYMKKRKK